MSPALRRRLTGALALTLTLAAVAASCGKQEDSPRAPPPPPPTALARDVAPIDPPIPDAAPAVAPSSASDEYTPSGVNPWNQTAFKAESRFSLTPALPADLTPLEAAIEAGALPTDDALQDLTASRLIAAFASPPAPAPAASPDPLTLSAVVLASPFDPSRAFVVLSVTAHAPAQDATAAVTFSKDAVKRYRLLGFQNHTLQPPLVAPASLRPGDTTAAVYEVELRDDMDGDLGALSISHHPTTANPTTATAPIQLPTTTNTPPDARFTLSVALFSELLIASPEAKGWRFASIEGLAQSAASQDPKNTQRAAFVALLKRARPLLSDLAPDTPLLKGPRKDTSKATTDIHPSDKEGIVRVFNQNRKDIEDCYKRVMMKHGASPGRLMLELVITESGQVEQVTIQEDSVGNGLGRCAAEKAERWKFSPLRKAVRIAKPWSF